MISTHPLEQDLDFNDIMLRLEDYDSSIKNMFETADGALEIEYVDGTTGTLTVRDYYTHAL